MLQLTSVAIKEKALELGFDACGVAPASDLPELGMLKHWLAWGYAGSMGYLQRSAEFRADVRRVLPSAQSVISTATLYNSDRPYSIQCADPSRAQIARYAWGEDYHVVVGARLDALLAWMHDVSPQPFEALAYVDTGPVQERAYAQRAGLGWIGKNTCVINPELGSWVFLAEIITSLPLEPDTPSLDQCGTCTLCLEACPTGALVAPRVLDSTRCISYWTIEHRGDIPEVSRASLGSHVFGCDVCQEVCPWNASSTVSADRRWQPRPAWDSPRLVDLLQMSDEEIRSALQGSAMKRAKLAGLRRNITIAVQNACEHHAETPHEVGCRPHSRATDTREGA
jgi:epoxyqueuosine reductase